MTDIFLGIILWTGRWSRAHPRSASLTALFFAIVALSRSWALACVAVIIVTLIWGLVKVAWTAHQGSALVGFLAALKATIRIANVKRRWPKAAMIAGFIARHDKLPPFLIGLRAHGENVTGILDLGSAGLTVDDVSSASLRLATTMRCRYVRVSPEPGVPSECRIVFEWRDPLDAVFTVPELRERASTEHLPSNHIPVALTETATILPLNTALSALLVGETGSGKSSLMWAGLAGFQIQGIPLRLRVIDPAGGVELSHLHDVGRWVWTVPASEEAFAGMSNRVVRYRGIDRRVLGPAQPVGKPPKNKGIPGNALRVCEPCLMGEFLPFHVHAYTDRAGEAEELIGNAHTAMFTRLRKMAGTGVRTHVPTLGEPHDLTIVDEMLLLKSLLNKGVESPAGEILTIGRKARYTFWGCSQLPQKEVLGDVRDLFPQRFCLAVRNREAVDLVLGPGALAAGAKAHLITDRNPGMGYRFSSENRSYIRFRGPIVPDHMAERIAAGKFVVHHQIDEPNYFVDSRNVSIGT